MVGPKVRSSGGGWLIDYGGIVEDVREPGFLWGARIIDDPSASRNHKESCAAPGSKARREKIRRDKLNDRFTELCSIMNPGKPPITDKFVILSDAAHFIKQLRREAKRLKESNEALQNSIKSVKGEKLELRNEKMRLKSEKERIEQMLKGSSTTTQFFTKPAATTLQPASPPALSKTIPYPNHIPTGMWQWIPPAAMDTSLDHVLRPPAA
ncbi:transcription factor bHLH115-like isoform X2 [Zingiber officinale]|uniref:transcription factor bHLH115-like isoform X2 n=1 Tax=Zingiber officinale TaxID=94328 RepID=UPI001C4CF6A5|nr:transcription factor bHLH115-like isoform X2 [Zingiber officinale]